MSPALGNLHPFAIAFLFGLLIIIGEQIKKESQPKVSEIPVTFYLALAPDLESQEHFTRHLKKVSDPTSPLYGAYLTPRMIDDFFQTPLHLRIKVGRWLSQQRIHDCTWYGDAVKCQAPAGRIERAFKVTFDYGFTEYSPETYQIGRTFLSTTESPQIPSHLREAIQFVEGFHQIHHQRQTTRQTKKTSTDPGFVNREVLQRLYKFPSAYLNPKITSVGAIEYQGQDGFSQKDLVNGQLANNLPSNPVGKNQTIGQPSFPDEESQLDIQMIGTVAAQSELWYEVTPAWMWSWALDFLHRPRVPYIVSLSWGWSESDQCTIGVCGNYTSRQYVERTNYEFLKLALRGVTIVVASGDAGSPGRTNEDCDRKVPEHMINPVFPGASQWVTSVGATYLVADPDQHYLPNSTFCRNLPCANGTEERGVTLTDVYWTSGAGFDRWTPTPDWQKPEVSRYLNASIPFPAHQYWHRQGRAYPDVSAIGHNCAVLNGQDWAKVDGTSCSAPIFAALLGILNDHQLSRQRPRLGFVNPLLYRMARDHPPAFYDVVHGNSSCTEQQCCGPDFGFVATQGWDVVSGLGTPNVQEMLRYLDSLKYPDPNPFPSFLPLKKLI